MKADLQPLYRLACPVQHYAWGGCRQHEREPVPFIADLLGLEAAPWEPFAELWIGAHPRFPCLVETGDADRKRSLDSLITQASADWLGPALIKRGIQQLPFLLKILDLASPLSIQAHPDRSKAACLHRRDPHNYPDTNHKPEIAIALEPGLEALSGFRPVTDIIADLERLPPLASLLDQPVPENDQSSWLSETYRRIFTASPENVTTVLTGLKNLLSGKQPLNSRDTWLLRLIRDFPGDRGCLSVYFLNLVELSPGQAMCIEPNRPHAYLRGTIIECMANSDNVVRAGLTNKHVDTDNLLQMLAYRESTPEISQGLELGQGERLYRGGAEEFQVEVMTHDRGFASHYQAGGTISLLLILNGSVRFEGEGWQQTGSRGTAWVWPGSLPAIKMNFLQDRTMVVRARPNLADHPPAD